jgi:hypothetical protein
MRAAMRRRKRFHFGYRREIIVQLRVAWQGQLSRV